MSERPIIGITMGDPAGVGPEVTAKALARDEVWDCCRPLVVGDAGVLAQAVALVEASLPLHSVADVAEAHFDPAAPDVLDLHNVDSAALQPGKVSATAGRAAVEAVERAVELAQAGQVDGIATGPINKAALQAAGIPYIGHTELLAALTGAERVTTMLATPGLRVVHVTRHVPLREVAAHITRERVLETIRLTDVGLKGLALSSAEGPALSDAEGPALSDAEGPALSDAEGPALSDAEGPALSDAEGPALSDAEGTVIPRPRLAVAALNPHGGDEGLLGREEIEAIGPAVEAARAEGIEAHGPIPADSVFFRAIRGEFDAVVAMYHDQGHIPIKTHGFERSVTVTLGLPIVRTSVDHGTAFDIAWQGVANEESMVEAIRLAAQLAS